MENSSEASGISEQNREPHPNSLANLKPFQPGQSGNPSGRPKKKPVTEALERLLNSEENAEEIAKALLDVVKARGKGTVSAAKEITDRVEGRVSDKVEHSGADGGPIQGEFTIRFVKASD
jgi:hypothetical protein